MKTEANTIPRKSVSNQRTSAAPKTASLKSDVFNIKGEKVNTITLSADVFGVKWNSDLVHEVVVSMQSNARSGTAHTKDRSEVRGGGRKPWRQKGTGRARHGSRRSPIWTGGGVTFGPRKEKNYSKKINRKVRAKALAITLSKKQSDGEMIFVDALSFDTPKTKEAKSIITALAKGSGHTDLATKRNNAALVVLGERSEATEKSFRNFGNIEVLQAKDINPVNLLTYKYVVIANPDAILKTLESRVDAKAPSTKKTTKKK